MPTEEQVAVQSVMRRKLEELQLRNPKISVRAFARRLGLQPAAANEILKGQRRISRNLAERLARNLMLSPTERSEFFSSFAGPRGRRPSGPKNTLRLTGDQFEAISAWVHFAILSLAKLPDFRSESAWISRRLGVSLKQANQAVDRLLRLGLLARDERGALSRTKSGVETTDDVASIAIRKAHIADLELVRHSILNHALELRDVSAMTMAVSTDLLPQAKELIRKAQDEIADLLESKPGDAVYRLSVHLYPLTTPPRKKPKETKK